jgi:lipopolysaccharide/colanic/teichoic acid biosynthesis glycosyltransferase
MIAGCLIVLLLPIYSMVSMLIYMAMGKPIFFRQKRPGYHGEIFEILKFRTMTNTQDREGNLLSDEKRLLGLGKWIRSTSLDELPQLVNVLKGDMSFVGPRPLLIEYLPLYTKKQSRRHEVKPGITGWAQINGRNAISWEEKFRYDIWYVDHFSFWLDLKIMWMTLIKVFARKDVNSKTSLTMEKFKGSECVK